MASLQMNFLSMKLGMQTNVTVLLPSCVPSPDTAGLSYEQLYPLGERFPTLWLLGTAYGDDGEWLRESAVLRLAQKHRIAGVLPCGFEKLYSDDPRGQQFCGYIADEVYAICAGTFPLSRRREDNLIGGASLGAYGALKCALHAPERFGSVLMLGGAYEKGISHSYFPALSDEMSRCGLIPPCALDDAGEADAELTAKPGTPKPEVWLGWASGSPLKEYARRAGTNLINDGFTVLAQKEFAGPEDWAFRDAALAEAVECFFQRRKEA